MSKSTMAPVRKMYKNLAVRRKSSLLQDIGLMLFLSAVAGAAVTVSFADTRRTEYVLLFVWMSASALLAAYRFRYLSAGLTGLQVLSFTVYTLFRRLVNGVAILPTDYVWLALPVAAAAGMQLFIRSVYRIEQSNTLLEEQMESVVLLDALTGLYNLRALYIDLQRQMAYSKRNGTQISLMVVKLRYADELRGILSRRRFSQLIQALAETISNCVRIEDRCYSIDTQTGEFAILLTCGKQGAEFVHQRIEAACGQKNAFAGILDKAVRVDLRIACVEYGEGIPNAIEFKHKVDSELQYDV